MAIVDIAELELLPPGQIVAGLDLGTKTIGVAMSDLGWSLAVPRPVIRRVKFGKDAEILRQMLDNEKVAAIVIGLPLNMDGSEGPRSQATRAFVRNYSRLDERPIAFWDERLSTVAAERGLLEMDTSRRKRAERIDSAAAAFILQGALDRLSSLRANGS
ncbi:Holliday junction resolvase RuvX [Mangrovicella endophytica]|uniref:Holliday junction resolvase RuvX n=1 Tax=Mangrovicella endophytica TaxID=2066697 RepID=UPI000C9DC9EC|nr:Holliday junction resolvase RuvX [Mangrovicella endophytica]